MAKVRYKRKDVNLPTEDIQNGDIVFVKGEDGVLREYNVLSDGEHHMVKGINEEEQTRLNRLNEEQVSKLEGLETQEQLNDRFSTIIAGEKGSINPTTVVGDLEDGIYRAEVEGTYDNIGGLVVESGKSVWFLKEGDNWTIYSEIDAAPATGIVQENNTGATSGNTVYRYTTPIKDKLDVTVKYTNYFNKVNLIEGWSVNTIIDPSGNNAEITQVSGSTVAWVELSPNTDYYISGYEGFDVVGRRLGLFQNMTDYSHAPNNRVKTRAFNSGNNRFLIFIVKHLAGGALANLDIIQVSEGTEPPQEYSPFGLTEVELGVSGKVEQEEKRAVSGQEVFPIKDKLDKIAYVKNLFDKNNGVIPNKILSVVGSVADVLDGEGTLAYAKLEKNKDYYLSGTTGFDIVGRRGGLFKDITSFVRGSDNRVTSRSFNSGDNEYFIFGIQYLSDIQENLDVIQIEEGVAPTSYAEFGKVFLRNVTKNERVTLLTGASFAYPGNPWFSMVEGELGKGYNRAVSNENITHTAAKMYNGSLYSFEEMEDFEYFLIMQTHNNDIADLTGIQVNYQDYEPIVANSIPRNQAWDYVLKRYRAECYNLKDNPDSRWYGTAHGKPCNIVVMTDWHDARTIFNSSIRTLRDRHGFNLIELDTQIGFNKNILHPVTGEQTSRVYAVDTQVIDGVTYGWHPIRTTDNPVQIRIARLCIDELLKL